MTKLTVRMLVAAAVLAIAGSCFVSYARAIDVKPPVAHSGITVTLMAPLMLGDAAKPDDPACQKDWREFDRQLAEAHKLGVDAISTDVWWGIVEPADSKFCWSYYDKLSDHIIKAGLRWVPILSLHECGGNVGDDVSIPVPAWIWPKLAAKVPDHDVRAVRYVSEQGNQSKEYVSAWATDLVLEDYAGVMSEFQKHFADKSASLSEINISLGPSGELRYPSYNYHDKNSGCPGRGALQAYSQLAKQSFRDFAISKYGSAAALSKAWSSDIKDKNAINPPEHPEAFFAHNDHLKLQYGRDFFDWYQDSLLNHGKKVMGVALKIFANPSAPFHGTAIGAKIPGIHWRIGQQDGNGFIKGDRLAELNCGMIRTSLDDWDSDAKGRGYRPILNMFQELQTSKTNYGVTVQPSFTAIELPDGEGGPDFKSLPHTLSTWVGQEAARQYLDLKGENAMGGSLANASSWDLMRAQLVGQGKDGYYHGVTLLRMSDVVNNVAARTGLAEIIRVRSALKDNINLRHKPAA